MKQNVINNQVCSCLNHMGIHYVHSDIDRFMFSYKNAQGFIDTADYSCVISNDSPVMKSFNHALIRWIIGNSLHGTAIEVYKDGKITTTLYNRAVIEPGENEPPFPEREKDSLNLLTKKSETPVYNHRHSYMPFRKSFKETSLNR